jgi:hypothetical protein
MSTEKEPTAVSYLLRVRNYYDTMNPLYLRYVGRREIKARKPRS